MFPLSDENPKHRPAIVMWLLVIINLAAAVYMYGVLNVQDVIALVETYGFIPALFFSYPLPNILDIYSSMFMHGSWIHLAGNLLFLWIFGDNVEDRMGPLVFLVFYLLGGTFAALCHALFTGDTNIAMIGASGAISAVMGAYFVLFPRHRILTLVVPFFLFWLPAWVYLGIWILMQLFEASTGLITTTGSSVAWWAHIGGFVFGMGFCRWFVRHPPYTPSQRRTL